MEKLTVTNKEKTIAKFSLQECDSSILKKPENSIASDFRETSPWWVPHWVKFQIFSSLGRYEQFLLWWRYNGKLNYLKLVAINLTIQSLLLNINKWNLKVWISSLLWFVFQFHIRLPNYGFENTLYSPLKIKVSPIFIFWATKSFFRTLRKNQIRKFFGPKILVCLV